MIKGMGKLCVYALAVAIIFIPLAVGYPIVSRNAIGALYGVLTGIAYGVILLGIRAIQIRSEKKKKHHKDYY